MRVIFEEFEVCFGDFGDGVGEGEAFESYDHYTMGFVVFYLASDACEGASYYADLSAWFCMGIVILPLLSLVVWVVTCLGLDEVIHILIGNREDNRPFVPVVLYLRHELQGRQVRICIFEQAEYLLLALYEDEVAEDGFYDFMQPITLYLLTMFQAEVGGEAFVIEILAYLEGFSDTGMTYVHGVPSHLAIDAVVIRTEVGIEVLVVAVEGGYEV